MDEAKKQFDLEFKESMQMINKLSSSKLIEFKNKMYDNEESILEQILLKNGYTLEYLKENPESFERVMLENGDFYLCNEKVIGFLGTLDIKRSENQIVGTRTYSIEDGTKTLNEFLKEVAKCI